MGSVFARGMVGFAPKFYSVTCGYYNTAGEKWVFQIEYRYTTSAGPWRLEKDKGPRREYLSPEQAEADLKRRVKHLIDSLRIKDLDTTRTKLYDRPFEMTEH